MDGIASLYLYGDIGEDFWSYDTITLKNVKNELENITANTIEVHINSYGGDIFESIAISNLLKTQGKKIVTIIDGIAASGGSIIAMAGEEIRMFENSQMMIHNPWTITAGNAKELKEVAEQLEKMQESLEQTYMGRFNGNLDELKALLDAESFFTAQDCVANGLADEIIEGRSIDPTDIDEELDDEINEEVISKLAEQIVASMNKTATVKVEKPKEKNEVVENKLIKLFIKGE